MQEPSDQEEDWLRNANKQTGQDFYLNMSCNDIMTKGALQDEYQKISFACKALFSIYQGLELKVMMVNTIFIVADLLLGKQGNSYGKACAAVLISFYTGLGWRFSLMSFKKMEKYYNKRLLAIEVENNDCQLRESFLLK